jgi:ankyrin repeat protein
MIIFQLLSASRNGNTDLVKYLVENGSNINKQNVDGDTALHFGNYKISIFA